MPKKPAELVKEVSDLKDKLQTVTLPPELKEKALAMVQRLIRMAKHGQYSTEYERVAYYVEWIVNLPWT